MRIAYAATKTTSSTPEALSGEDVRLPVRHDQRPELETGGLTRCLVVDENLAASQP
jgi:hypothetical protein